ncbi:acetylglutamate kinase [Arachidicoccus terrestris]|uniref:acetylglutamate kinase n=1 Tax=Arachidicoccus terrestris TaxID=2875539 RepID=UPI001CC339FB|nr:acetylglutamate kinase [Arachidicoccus terrestris]UAY56293.1 acetylglutamate kinase [Arachidicoccus terrestris]
MEQLFVIKIGGNVIDDPEKLRGFLQTFAGVKGKKILVHGGGKIATKIGQQLGMEPNYHQGRRITDDQTIDLVTMVYGGLVNKKIVASLQALQVNAIGLTGADANVIPAVKRPVKEVDFGWVGDVHDGLINTVFLSSLLQQDITPVFAALTHDGQGHMLNTNADTIASVLAVALSAAFEVRLIYCFEKKGVLMDIENEDSVIGQIDQALYQQLLTDKKLFEGIIPKIDNAFAAIHSGVKDVLIGDSNDLYANTTINTKGTLIHL